MSHWDRLPVDIRAMIFEMDSTFRSVFQKSMREISVLRTRHVMDHYCRVFFQNCVLPCEAPSASIPCRNKKYLSLRTTTSMRPRCASNGGTRERVWRTIRCSFTVKRLQKNFFMAAKK